MKKLIVLDRDGVINYDRVDFIKTPEQFIPLPGSLEAIANLTKNGYQIVICTNQSGIGRGLFTLEALAAVHAKMESLVNAAGGKITDIYFCPHTPLDNCNCRKPKSGMLEEIAKQYTITDIKNLVMVGDSERDLVAIDNFGGQPILVRTGNGQKTIANGNIPASSLIFDDLLAVSEYLLSGQQ